MKGSDGSFQNNHYWWNPTKILLGRGKVQELAAELDRDWNFDGKSKCLVVTDQGIKDAGLLDYLLDSLKVSSRQVVGVSDGSSGETTSDRISEIALLAQEAEADFWIALGGGSVMATCKAAAVLESNGGNLEDFFGHNRVTKETKPIVCIPTTAGTGAEVSCQAFIMNGKKKKRRIRLISDYKFIPKIAVLDPELTRTLPAHLVATTGLYALSNAIRALTSKNSHELSASISLKAIEIVINNLVEAYRNNGSNQDVRCKMLIAAAMGGISSQTVLLGAEHWIGTTADCFYGLPPGLAVSIAHLHVMESNRKSIAVKYAALARVLGLRNKGFSDEALGMKGIEKLRELYSRVGVGLTFREYGCPVDEASIEKFIVHIQDNSRSEFQPSGVDKTPQFELLVRNCFGV